MTGVAWVGRGLVPLEEATVPIDDRGLTTGDGCFETMKVAGGTPFALTRHLRRLARSCAALDIAPPPDDLVREAVSAVVAANDGPSVVGRDDERGAGAGRVGRVRVTVTAGRAPLGPARGDAEPGFFVLAGAPRVLGPSATIATCPWVRNERSPLAGAKATSYGDNVVAARWAAARGCDEAIFANTVGELCEGTGSNLFLVVDGVLRTPPLSSGCLAGVTRELVCEVVDVDESPLPLAALAEASEVFLTSSTRDVHPVSAVDGRMLGCPGPLTADVRGQWQALVARGADP